MSCLSATAIYLKIQFTLQQATPSITASMSLIRVFMLFAAIIELFDIYITNLTREEKVSIWSKKKRKRPQKFLNEKQIFLDKYIAIGSWKRAPVGQIES